MSKLLNLKKKSFHSAKVSVKRGKLYGNSQISKLADMSFDEILKYMEENNFRDVIDGSYFKYEGFYLVEKILNQYLSRIYKNITVSASGANRVLFEQYYLKYQIHNLMVLIRCKISDEKDIDAYLIGDLRKRSKFIKAYDMSTIEESISYICNKLKLDTQKVLEKYEEGLFELENYLYKTYYERLNSYTLKYNLRDEREFVKFIRSYVDLINSRAFGKLLVEDEIKIQFSQIYIPGGNLSLSFFEKFSNSDIKSYLEALCENLGDSEEFSSILQLDKEISKHKSKASVKFKKASFGSPFYAFKYLFEVEREISKLRILLKGKSIGMDKEEILKLI